MCVRCSLRSSVGGEVIDTLSGFAATILPFTAGGWNTIYGIFDVGETIVRADNVALYCDGPDEGVDFMLDDVSIIPVVHLDPEDEGPDDSGCIDNGNFEVGDGRGW